MPVLTYLMVMETGAQIGNMPQVTDKIYHGNMSSVHVAMGSNIMEITI